MTSCAEPRRPRPCGSAIAVRAGGDLVEIAPGRRLELDPYDVVVATAGSLVHARLRDAALFPTRSGSRLSSRQATAAWLADTRCVLKAPWSATPRSPT